GRANRSGGSSKMSEINGAALLRFAQATGNASKPHFSISDPAGVNSPASGGLAGGCGTLCAAGEFFPQASFLACAIAHRRLQAAIVVGEPHGSPGGRRAI